MTTYVIGTAGHVDHGKSTLVKAMTGMDPDRLREEKERQLTIDLGFAWMTLPGELQVGIVDVPGHRDFIENMLAGVGGIDAALLVIAADEGVMPQTSEHLEILDLLEIPRGLIALTKVDLIEEGDWLDLVEEEIREVLQNTVLADAPIFRVSSLEGKGVEELKAAIGELLADAEPSSDLGRARMPIDRVFSLSGYGTIVTGTLLDGRLEVGDQVRILPADLEGRIRNLQTHKQDVKLATPGSRVAVNVSGVDVGNIQRGDVLAADSSDEPTKLIDARVRVLASSPTSIEHNQQVKLFVGADQKIARVRVLGGKERIGAGEVGWIQLMARDPMVVRREDRFILRRPSPPLTLGGGRVVDPHPARRHRLNDLDIIGRLERLLEGTRDEIVAGAVEQLGPVSAEAIGERVNMPFEEVLEQLALLEGTGEVIALETVGSSDPIYLGKHQFNALASNMAKLLQEFHKNNPLRFGMPVEELRSRLGFSQDYYASLLDKLLAGGEFEREGATVHLASFQPELTAKQQALVESLLDQFELEPYSPPSVKESRNLLGEELYTYLVANDSLTEVSPDVVFRSEDYQGLKKVVAELIERRGQVTVAEVRDELDTSRKYVLALLEHLDQIGVTVREGDHRRLA